jgi:hypothetical protein
MGNPCDSCNMDGETKKEREGKREIQKERDKENNTRILSYKLKFAPCSDFQ